MKNRAVVARSWELGRGREGVGYDYERTAREDWRHETVTDPNNGGSYTKHDIKSHGTTHTPPPKEKITERRMTKKVASFGKVMATKAVIMN